MENLHFSAPVSGPGRRRGGSVRESRKEDKLRALILCKIFEGRNVLHTGHSQNTRSPQPVYLERINNHFLHKIFFNKSDTRGGPSDFALEYFRINALESSVSGQIGIGPHCMHLHRI